MDVAPFQTMFRPPEEERVQHVGLEWDWPRIVEESGWRQLVHAKQRDVFAQRHIRDWSTRIDCWTLLLRGSDGVLASVEVQPWVWKTETGADGCVASCAIWDRGWRHLWKERVAAPNQLSAILRHVLTVAIHLSGRES